MVGQTLRADPGARQRGRLGVSTSVELRGSALLQLCLSRVRVGLCSSALVAIVSYTHCG